jgi:23S rRNA pseudouridine1911/1915/1917 synthase
LKNEIFYVAKEHDGMRIDTYLNSIMKDLNRDKIQSIIANGGVKNGYTTVKVFSERVQKKDKITVSFDPNKGFKKIIKHKKGRKIVVLHEDDDIIVINKDSGLLTVPSRKGALDNTAIKEINKYISKKYNDKKSNIVFIVHRLDRDTSGVMVFARHRKAQEFLKKQFLDHSIDRKYSCILSGHLEKKAGKIQSFLTDDEESKNFRVKSTKDSSEGHEAITHYSVKKEIEGFSLIDAKLETGKRNQIRVHFADLGHPIMGDRKYSKNKKQLFDMPRLALHASELGFIHPTTKKRVFFEAQIPASFQNFIFKHS